MSPRLQIATNKAAGVWMFLCLVLQEPLLTTRLYPEALLNSLALSQPFNWRKGSFLDLVAGNLPWPVQPRHTQSTMVVVAVVTGILGRLWPS